MSEGEDVEPDPMEERDAQAAGRIRSAATARHLGLDLGGTRLKWAVLERGADTRRQLDSGSEPTRLDGGAAGLVAQLVACAREAALRWPEIASAGIGVPGVYDGVAGTIRFTPNIPVDWAGTVVADPVAAALDAPARLINDARAFMLAELRLGAARGALNAIGLTLGTGVGGGLAIDGRLYFGHDGTAGEIGHQTIDPDGPFCHCGNRGCLEAYTRADQIALACGTPDVETAVRRAREGDQRARAGLQQVGRYLGIGIASMITVLTPDVIVLGGGVANAGDLLLNPLRDELRQRVRTTALDRVELVVAELGYWAGAIGAALYGAECTLRPAPVGEGVP